MSVSMSTVNPLVKWWSTVAAMKIEDALVPLILVIECVSFISFVAPNVFTVCEIHK